MFLSRPTNRIRILSQKLDQDGPGFIYLFIHIYPTSVLALHCVTFTYTDTPLPASPRQYVHNGHEGRTMRNHLNILSFHNHRTPALLLPRGHTLARGHWSLCFLAATSKRSVRPLGNSTSLNFLQVADEGLDYKAKYAYPKLESLIIVHV